MSSLASAEFDQSPPKATSFTECLSNFKIAPGQQLKKKRTRMRVHKTEEEDKIDDYEEDIYDDGELGTLVSPRAEDSIARSK
eukprot:CAMPEP_0170451048 /NCGR_PEP_ID=MMETSP0123-20130129/408_1 /TAXON_ID=182087 /ORGANISM="Favella ehrenbergii, Strain Fehren 1" /LENGTH=81 /DNA_ID=CAMNT_0010712587 /DNA_START=652 /DNA_END=897 /DNA_ORIENTATION=-